MKIERTFRKDGMKGLILNKNLVSGKKRGIGHRKMIYVWQLIE
jgi:hypothetical protein